MTPRPGSPRQDPAASRAIDAIIEAPGDWRSTTLARLRAVILSAGASIVVDVSDEVAVPGRASGPGPVSAREIAVPIRPDQAPAAPGAILRRAGQRDQGRNRPGMARGKVESRRLTG